MNFTAVLALPKTAGLPRHIKVWVSFELFGVLGIYNFAVGSNYYDRGVNQVQWDNSEIS